MVASVTMRMTRWAPFWTRLKSGDWVAICWQIREPLPIIPRTVSVNVVHVSWSPTSVSNGSKYCVNGSFQASSHFLIRPPVLHEYPASILPQPGKEDYEWMSSASPERTIDMAASASQHTFRPIPCAHCQRVVSWPRWRKIAAQSYHPLCWSCFAASHLIVTLARRNLYADR